MNARIVEPRSFAGLSNNKIAALMEINEKTGRLRPVITTIWRLHALEKVSGILMSRFHVTMRLKN